LFQCELQACGGSFWEDLHPMEVGSGREAPKNVVEVNIERVLRKCAWKSVAEFCMMGRNELERTKN